MKTLFLDTTSNTIVLVRLTIDDNVFEEKREIKNNRTQIILPLIQKLLNDHNLSPRDITRVELNSEPGSFTGVRVGAAIANSLIFGLGLPQDLIEPVYS